MPLGQIETNKWIAFHGIIIIIIINLWINEFVPFQIYACVFIQINEIYFKWIGEYWFLMCICDDSRLQHIRQQSSWKKAQKSESTVTIEYTRINTKDACHRILTGQCKFRYGDLMTNITTTTIIFERKKTAALQSTEEKPRSDATTTIMSRFFVNKSVDIQNPPKIES